MASILTLLWVLANFDTDLGENMDELFQKIPGTFPCKKRVRAVCVVCVR
jgi:hypothetical protein